VETHHACATGSRLNRRMSCCGPVKIPPFRCHNFMLEHAVSVVRTGPWRRPVPRSTANHNTPMHTDHTITTVMDDRGIPKTLAGTVARGGEGTIRSLAGRDDILAKIYHPAILADAARRARLERKIRDMAGHAELRAHSQLAWPLLPLRSPDTGWCGFAMRRVPGVCLRSLLGGPALLAARCPGWHRQHLVRLCLDVLDAIGFLSRHHAMPVDFNPSNLLVDTTGVRAGLIDCDGFQFQGVGGLHPCGALTLEMAAPEVIGMRGGTHVPAESVRFSVAMLLFYILTLGNSPYRHRNGGDPVHNLASGACALGRGASHAPPSGSFYRIWSHLIFDLKELFIRCFRDGHSRPELRPALSEWREALLKYNRCLVLGHAEASPVPRDAKPSRHNSRHPGIRDARHTPTPPTT